MRTIGFRIGKRGFFVLARKSRDCAEAYDRTPHKQNRRLTPPGRKSTLSGRKLSRDVEPGSGLYAEKEMTMKEIKLTQMVKAAG